jgi:hypothetical protein
MTLPAPTDGSFDLRFASPLSPAPPALAAIPEPASWALMIAGFGTVGLAARRRRPSQLVS